MVVRCGDYCGTVGVRHSEVDTAIIVNANRGVAAAGNRLNGGIANMADVPGYSIIFRDYYGPVATAVIVR
jgi:hypothetical protein